MIDLFSTNFSFNYYGKSPVESKPPVYYSENSEVRIYSSGEVVKVDEIENTISKIWEEGNVRYILVHTGEVFTIGKYDRIGDILK